MERSKEKVRPKSELPHLPVRKIMGSVTGNTIAKEAVEVAKKAAEEFIKDVTSAAMKLTKNAKRSKISKDDVNLALKLVK